MTTSSLYDLFHLSDSALPAGGYAFSNGLEVAYHQGLTSADLEAYVQTVLFFIASSELPFIHSSFKRKKDLTDLFWFYDAMLTASAQVRSSLTLGRTWLRLMPELYPETERVKIQLSADQLPAHYTLVFAWTLEEAGFEKSDACQVYMYQTLRDQISAAIRLGILGPLEATRLQKKLYSTCETAIQHVDGIPYECATRGAAQLEIAQATHEYLYTRLFQS